MRHYIIRLDDASDHMNLEKWEKIEKLLDKYHVKPIFGIIPSNKDESLLKYEYNPNFWNLMHSWIDKGWIPAMHGYEHKYVTDDGGINPVNKKSEFAGLSYKIQVEKIRKGYNILIEHGIKPEIFFAPSHTFDENTLKAIKSETPIRVISDTVAWDVYKKDDFVFIPQQSGRVRNLPFKTVTFCYHPNTMDDNMFVGLQKYLDKYQKLFINSNTEKSFYINRKKTIIDKIVNYMYFKRRNI